MDKLSFRFCLSTDKAPTGRRSQNGRGLFFNPVQSLHTGQNEAAVITGVVSVKKSHSYFTDRRKVQQCLRPNNWQPILSNESKSLNEIISPSRVGGGIDGSAVKSD